MKQEIPEGKIVEITLKDGDTAIGYWQYKERGTVFISVFSHGMSSFGILTEDIKKITEL